MKTYLIANVFLVYMNISGEDGSPEEGLPLKTGVLSADPHVNAGADH